MDSKWTSFSSKLRKTNSTSHASTLMTNSTDETCLPDTSSSTLPKISSQSDAIRVVQEISQDKQNGFSLISHSKFTAHHKLRSQAYKAYQFLVHRNSLSSAGWIVCLHVLSGCCSLEKGVKQFDVSKGGTSSLVRHSDSHKRISGNSFEKKHKLSAGVKESITKGAVYAVVKDSRPFGFTAKGSGLQEFVDTVFKAGQNTAAGVTVDAEDLMPNRQSIRNCLSRMVDEARKLFVSEKLGLLLDAGGGVTCDGLKHSVTGVKYYDLIAHWVEFSTENIFTNECNVFIRSQVLMLIPIDGPESAMNLRTLLSKGLEERYRITLNKLLTRHTLVTDCASTLPCIVGASSSSKKVPYTSKWMGCICHQLNTCMKRVFDVEIQDGNLRQISSNLKAAKTMVRIFKKSSIELPSGLHLKQEVETRFSTTFFVVERFLECAQEIRETVLSLPDPPSNLLSALQELDYDVTQHDFATIPPLNAIYIVCKPIAMMQKVMEASGKPTLHRLLPMLEHCKQILGKMGGGNLFSADIPNGSEAVRVVDASGFYVRELAKVMLESLKRIEVHPLWCAGTILHPRLALMSFVKDQSRRENYMRSGKAEIRKMMALHLGKSVMEPDRLNGNNPQAATQHLAREERRLSVAARDQLQFSLETALDCPVAQSTGGDELSKYIKSAMPDDIDDLMSKDDLGSLRWWVKMKGSYPNLYKVALRVLSTPASSCASERNFSLVNNTVSASRSQLTTEAVEDLIFAKSLINNGFSF